MTNENKKEQIIFQEVNQFFQRIIEYKNTDNLKNFFTFLKKMRDHAPFNSALVFIQNPNSVYYATATQWEKKFNRKIKDGARPMLILQPFGPVNFVYDFTDTYGEDNFSEDNLYWWKDENNDSFNYEVIDRIITNLKKKYQIETKINKNLFEYVKFNSPTTMGYASRHYKDDKREIAVHPRYANNSELAVESYGVLCHEIAHHLLGHLGDIKILDKKGRLKTVVKGRRVERKIEELEAELAAWIVFLMHDLEKNSIQYIAQWISGENDFKKISISEVLKVAKKIYDLGK